MQVVLSGFSVFPLSLSIAGFPHLSHCFLSFRYSGHCSGAWGAVTTQSIHPAWDLVALLSRLAEGGMREVPVPLSPPAKPFLEAGAVGEHFSLHPTTVSCSRNIMRYDLHLGRQQQGMAWTQLLADQLALGNQPTSFSFLGRSGLPMRLAFAALDKHR